MRIIEVGAPAVPVLLECLDDYPHVAMAALGRITRHNPVRDSDAGQVARMVHSWKKWGWGLIWRR